MAVFAEQPGSPRGRSAKKRGKAADELGDERRELQLADERGGARDGVRALPLQHAAQLGARRLVIGALAHAGAGPRASPRAASGAPHPRIVASSLRAGSWHTIPPHVLFPGRTTPLTPTEWLICFVAALGFAFDIYELLMLPLIVRPALLELLGVAPGTPSSTPGWAGCSRCRRSRAGRSVCWAAT